MRRTTDMKICGITRPADVRMAQQAGQENSP
jgi:phosphoribosylanthranilate isomerase